MSQGIKSGNLALTHQNLAMLDECFEAYELGDTRLTKSESHFLESLKEQWEEQEFISPYQFERLSDIWLKI